MGIYDAKDRLPSQVSGGEAQRAAIARAMINSPRLIYADEPTGALNKANSEEVTRLLTELNENGQSILMVTHDAKTAVHGNRLMYLEDGRIIDELKLPDYKDDDVKLRESRVNEWLSSLQW
jgi:putative ABC transport system ATP-binding protein